MPDLFIGLMSGTSLDGVDGALVDFETAPGQVLAHHFVAMPATLRAEFLALNAPGGSDELHRAALAANTLARVYAQVVTHLLHQWPDATARVQAIGAHGQTLRHRPGEFDGTGYTLQLNQPALLAELTGIPVVADFRSRDVAAGGQGAPLVPPFHQAWFGRSQGPRAVLNIGGIANLTLLDGASGLAGFDCGPGNVLMDGWIHRHHGRSFDDNGAWAASGKVHAALLGTLLNEPFFSLKPPKSTGRDLFHLPWLDRALQAYAGIAPCDVQATLLELTARCCVQGLAQVPWPISQLVVCGGGALNEQLMGRLQALAVHSEVMSSAQLGLPPLQVEATAFAWLARQTLRGETSSIPSVTGARGARVLGAIYPA